MIQRMLESRLIPLPLYHQQRAINEIKVAGSSDPARDKIIHNGCGAGPELSQ